MTTYTVDQLTKVYPGSTTPANDAITFNVNIGEIFGLLGANGAGKTTLVKQMANLLAPTAGTIRLFGKPLNDHALYTPGQIGYMPQDIKALNTLTVGETLYFTAHLRGLSRLNAQKERDRLLERFDLEPLRRRPVNRLSGGQKRLVLLATAMIARPPVLILDEPTNDLDPEYRRRVWDDIRQINHHHGTTIILVTHNILEAEKVIERVGIMQAGRLIALGRPGQLKGPLNHKLRLKLVFVPDNPPALPDGLTPHETAPGQWQITIDQVDAPRVLARITQQDGVEDFQLSTATLEDLYLHLAQQQGA